MRAPQAKQVADRFHLLQNFRETVERQLGGYEAPIRDSRSMSAAQAASPLPVRSDCPSEAVTQKRLIRRGRQAVGNSYSVRSGRFLKGAVPSGRSPTNSALVADGLNAGSLGSNCRTQQRRQRLHPGVFRGSVGTVLGGRHTKVRHLFAEIRHRGYTGSFSHLARFLAPWRGGEPSLEGDEREEPAPDRVRTLDPMTGRVISPPTAAALCVKPRGQMTTQKAANVDAMNAASAEFTAMRRLAMRFRGLLRGGNAGGVGRLADRRASGIYAMQRFAKTIRQDLEAVRNGVSEPSSNGQTERQINKLKTLRRAMYGRAGRYHVNEHERLSA